MTTAFCRNSQFYTRNNAEVDIREHHVERNAHLLRNMDVSEARRVRNDSVSDKRPLRGICIHIDAARKPRDAITAVPRRWT